MPEPTPSELWILSFQLSSYPNNGIFSSCRLFCKRALTMGGFIRPTTKGVSIYPCNSFISVGKSLFFSSGLFRFCYYNPITEVLRVVKWMVRPIWKFCHQMVIFKLLHTCLTFFLLWSTTALKVRQNVEDWQSPFTFIVWKKIQWKVTEALILLNMAFNFEKGLNKRRVSK